MSSQVLGVVLLGALLHASWNAMVKSRTDTFLVTVLVAGGAGLLSALGLLMLPAPAAASWPYIAVSTVVQLAYYALLVAAYRNGDMSHAYPLMRGSAPLLVALASGPLIGERLGAAQWLAVGCICGGIMALFFTARTKHPGAQRTTIFALMTACMIASFTLIDGVGVRLSGAPLAYTMWIYMLTAPAGRTRRVRAHEHWRAAAGRYGEPGIVFGCHVGDDTRAGGRRGRAARNIDPVCRGDRRAGAARENQPTAPRRGDAGRLRRRGDACGLSGLPELHFHRRARHHRTGIDRGAVHRTGSVRVGILGDIGAGYYTMLELASENYFCMHVLAPRRRARRRIYRGAAGGYGVPVP
jgi:multidrug transporter EmrE-like cation transporter